MILRQIILLLLPSTSWALNSYLFRMNENDVRVGWSGSRDVILAAGRLPATRREGQQHTLISTTKHGQVAALAHLQ